MIIKFYESKIMGLKWFDDRVKKSFGLSDKNTNIRGREKFRNL